MRRLSTLLVVGFVVLFGWSLFSFRGTHAQEPRCFAETGQCIEGRFRIFWEQNGGLPIFGYPLTSAREEVNSTDGQVYVTQWFERNRFELHPENDQPYDVLLGALGSTKLQIIQAQAVVPTTIIAPEFVNHWHSYGIELGDAGISERESLALFGHPISEVRMETNLADGQAYLTQWFERARFEYHPELEQWVQLGLLGQELMSSSLSGVPDTAARPYDSSPTPTPTIFSLQVDESSDDSSDESSSHLPPPDGDSKLRDDDGPEPPTVIPPPTDPLFIPTSTPPPPIVVTDITDPTFIPTPTGTSTTNTFVENTTQQVPSVTATATATPTPLRPTAAGRQTNTTEPTATAMGRQTYTPQPTDTSKPTSGSTATPTPKPTTVGRQTYTPQPTATSKPTSESTATPTHKPTATKTLSPTPKATATKDTTAP